MLDHGRAIAAGTPSELKSRIGEERIDVTVRSPEELAPAAVALSPFGVDAPTIDHASHTVSTRASEKARPLDVLRALDERGIDVTDLVRRQPTLDDVFLTLTATPETPR